MQYASSRPFHGDLERSFDLAVAALTALGFRLNQRTANSLQLTGPGMNSNRQSPLLGASQLDISFRQGQLDLAADLGAAQRLIRFVRIFPIALSGVLGLVFLVVFGAIFAGRAAPLFWISPVIAVTLINGAVWAVLSPWIARNIHQRTCRGLDTLLSTMAVTGEQAEKGSAAITS
jgi:hypothetical protein